MYLFRISPYLSLPEYLKLQISTHRFIKLSTHHMLCRKMLILFTMSSVLFLYQVTAKIPKNSFLWGVDYFCFTEQLLSVTERDKK